MLEGTNFRRAYFECRFGQLHCRNAFPSTGGFDERVALVCLHDVPGSSASLAGLIADFGSDRSVYAPDLLGLGGSDPAPGEASLGDHALAISDLVTSLRLREVDALGIGAGAAIAAELALVLPQRLRRLALILPQGGNNAPWDPAPTPAADGSHLAEGWRRLRASESDAPPGVTTRRLADWLLAVDQGGMYHALTAWRALERVAKVTTPTLVLATAPAPGRTVPPRARSQPVPDLSASTFLAQGSRAARELRRFLDG